MNQIYDRHRFATMVMKYNFARGPILHNMMLKTMDIIPISFHVALGLP